MSPVKFCQYFASDILQELWKQRESEKLFCDVVLISGTKKMKIPAHSCVLSAASKYFNRMFSSSMREGTTKEVEIPTVDYDILQLLVQYCYTGLIEISEDHVVELLRTAEMLLLRNVVTICINFLAERLHPSNCLGFAMLAEQHHCETLLQKANDYILEHFMEVRETEEFLSLNAEQLGELLESDELSVSFEKDVFEALKNWIDYNRIEREKHQVELLKLVRLPLLGRSFLKQHVKPICISMNCLQIYIEALEQDPTQYYVQQNERKLVKLKKSKQLLMGLSLRGNRMCIHYYCKQQLKWMKWSKDLDQRGWSSVAFIEDNLYLVGGFQSAKPLNTVVCLNLKTMNLRDVKPMLEHRTWCGVAVLNGFLYAVGGGGIDGVELNSVEKWNSNDNTWTKVASMGVRRSAFGLAVLNEKLYAVGGVTNGKVKVNSAECYDPLQDVWMPIASTHEVRHGFGIAVCKKLLYVVGGLATKTVERYNPETNSWTILCSLNNCLWNRGSCTTFRDKVIVFHEDRVDEYNAKTNEWKPNASLKVLHKNDCIFTHSGELRTSNFVEMPLS